MVKKQKKHLLDEQLFREEMAGVVPLKTIQRTDSSPPRKSGTPRNHGDFPEDLDISFNAATDGPNSIESPDGSSHRKDGVQKKTLQKLKRGRFAVDAELDLHNMNTKTARTVLLGFIADARAKSLVSVRIIHGKGLRSERGPVLKLMTREVLRGHPGVLAYTTCKPADGGEGAVDILLKSS